MKSAIFTGSDNKYFSKLINLLKSLNNYNCHLNSDIYVFSINHTDLQKKEILKLNAKIIYPIWNFELNFDAPEWKKLLTLRPFLRDYKSGYDNYIWLDADTIVKSKNFIETFNTSIKFFDGSIVPEFDFSYINFEKDNTFRNIFGDYYKIRGWSYKNNAKYIDKNLAQKLLGKPILNAGVYSFKSDSTIWKDWKEKFLKIIRSSRNDYCLNMDQASLNACIYKNRNKFNFLNSKFNWLIKNKVPYIDKKQNLYTCNYPFEKIEIIHLTQVDDDNKYDFYNFEDNRNETHVIKNLFLNK